jgi:hypothetical protein
MNSSGMKRNPGLLGLALTLLPLAAPEPLRVSTVVSPKPYFVGQAIEVKVEVDPGPASPTIEAPRISGAELFPMPTDPVRPSTARFVVVPGHPGPLDLPTFRARAGDRTGASKPTRLAIANVPAEGRTSAFLGGVGPFEVRAEVDQTNVRSGDTLEFRVNLSGLAAWGSVRAPDLNEWNSPTMKVEPLNDRMPASNPPTRTFRYRLRLLKPGKVVLPPVAIAAFDPTTRRYPTRATSSVTIRVEEPPRFDPSRLDYPPLPKTPQGWRPGPVGLSLGLLAAGSGLALAVRFVARRSRKSAASDPRTLALELAEGLEGGDDEVEAARAVAGALTTFLHQASGRSTGVLTPLEARAGFERLTNDLELPRFAEALVSRCDRARFGAVEGESTGMIREGRRFFEGLAEVLSKEGREEEGPGEAVKTA